MTDVALRPLEDGDVAELHRIHSTPEVARWWGAPEPGFPWTDEPDATRFTIVSDGSAVGLIQFYEEAEPRYRHASVDIFIDPAVRGRGIGTEALNQLVRYLHEERGHHRITIDPAVDNAAAIRSYEKAGFTRVGVMRRYECDTLTGDWRDGLLMEWVASE